MRDTTAQNGERTLGPADRRPTRTDSLTILDVPRWAEQLRSMSGSASDETASTLLLREPPVRVLLTALRSGAQLGSERADETLLVNVLSGAVTVEWHGEQARLAEREIAIIPSGGGWRITSDAPESIVLSTFWGTPGTADPQAPAPGNQVGT
jgi:hypothetical protein